MADRTIDIARDFSPYPGGRYRDRGKFSGEEFRDSVLLPALSEGSRVIVILDGAAGYSASFLEEAFGGLVRVHHISPERLAKQLTVQVTDPHYDTYRRLIEVYIKDAHQRLQTH